MSTRNCTRCNTRHGYPWGKSCNYFICDSDSASFEEDHIYRLETELTTVSKQEFGSQPDLMDSPTRRKWLTEVVEESRRASHAMVKDMEARLQTTIEERLSGIEQLLAGREDTKRDFSNPYPLLSSTYRQPAPVSARLTVPLTDTKSHGVTGTDKGSQHQAAAEENPSSAGATGQLSDALRQLSLAMDIGTATRTEGINLDLNTMFNIN